MKRLFDIFSSFIGIVVLLPVFFVIIMAVLVTMPGPIFFRQIRVGKNQKLFKLNKFRTMTVQKGADYGHFDAGKNNRITSLGKILRKSKLDELPQLFNVLVGDMSIVGPRPEVQKWTKVYPHKWEIVLTVKPGITDNASIHFRNEEVILAKSLNPEDTYRNEILPIKLDYYISYVSKHSFFGDIIIIIKTMLKILTK